MIKTLGKEKNNNQVFSSHELWISSFLTKGEDLAGKEYEKEPQVLQNISKNIFFYTSLSSSAFQILLHTPFPYVRLRGVRVPTASQHKTLRCHIDRALRSCCCPSKPGYLQRTPLCWSKAVPPQNEVVNLSLKSWIIGFLSSQESLVHTHNLHTETLSP